MIDTTEIHILPLMNPDGATKAEVGKCESEAGKTNANNIDLDQNFIGKKGTAIYFSIKTFYNRSIYKCTYFLLALCLIRRVSLILQNSRKHALK